MTETLPGGRQGGGAGPEWARGPERSEPGWSEQGWAERGWAGGPELFEERQFRWPEQPGDPAKEARLPWFWFMDVGEARIYLALFTLVNVFWLGLVTSMWILHNQMLWLALAVPATLTWLAYLRLWIGLCKRVRPPLDRKQWFMAGWLNP